MSAQNQSDYMTGSETELQMQVVDKVNSSTSVCGTPLNDRGPAAFKTSVANGSISVDEFLSMMPIRAESRLCGELIF